MTLEQMKESLKTIKLLEKDLMRDLTKEEKEIVINQGWEYFLFEYLHLTDEDFKELKALRTLISAFYTKDEDLFDEVVKNTPDSVYFVLRDIIDELEGMEKCTCPESPDKEDPIEDYTQFMEDLYHTLPKTETSWFNKLTEDLHQKLFDVYKEHRNDKKDCSDNLLGGIMTDAVKDEVVKDMVEKLKAGETVEMTNDEYLEVADYLCQTEDHIFLSNENGKVRLTLL